MCNCWHENEEESMTMWQKYRYHNSGVAIKTTMRNLKKSLSIQGMFLLVKSGIFL